MARRPIESVADAQRRAKRRIPRPIYTALISGNEKGVTMRANVDAFAASVGGPSSPGRPTKSNRWAAICHRRRSEWTYPCHS